MGASRVLLVSLVGLLALGTLAAPAAAARAFFIFGDSLVDNGNNNYLATTARADAPPYGIDFPTHRPTGRFSNGLNIPDIISEHIGSVPTLPYLSPELQGERLLVGANFASAGIGVLNDTGIQFMNIIRIARQMEFFQQHQQRLAALVGPDEALRVVNGALVLITLGGNDFVNNYYLVPFSARSRQFALPDYVVYVISEYKKVLAAFKKKINRESPGPLSAPTSALVPVLPVQEFTPPSPNGGLQLPQTIRVLTALELEPCERFPDLATAHARFVGTYDHDRSRPGLSTDGGAPSPPADGIVKLPILLQPLTIPDLQPSGPVDFTTVHINWVGVQD